MIAKHSAEESKHGEGVEVVENCPIDDPDHGLGQYTEKRIHLSNRLPSWIVSIYLHEIQSVYFLLHFKNSCFFSETHGTENILHYRKGLELLSFYHH